MRPWVIRGGQRNRLVDVFLSEQVTGVGYATIGDARDLESSDIANHLVEEGTSRNVALHTGCSCRSWRYRSMTTC